MAKTIQNMDSLFKEKERAFYNRYLKKIYKGRIEKASDKKYALEEYEKKFRFEIEFPLVNDNYKEFISFFERHDKLGHSMSTVIRLLPKGREGGSFELISVSESSSDDTSEPIVEIIKKDKADRRSVSIEDEDVNGIGNRWDKHFEKNKPAELITEYAHRKAKKRFHEFLSAELLQFQSSENIPETTQQETTIIKNKEHTARRQTLAIYYLDLHFKINREGKDAALIRFIQFLTDKNIDKIIRALRNPLKNSEKKKIRADEELLKDLKYIRIYFEDLGLTSIIKKIDEDIITISEDMK